MANGHGGARPGAGRKGTKVVAYQARMLELVHKAVTKDVWLNVVKTATQQAERGDKDARNWLTPWILGAPPKAPEEGADTSMVAKPDL